MDHQQKKTVFLMDDDHIERHLNCSALEKEGFRVIPINEPEDVVEKAKEIRPDLIFLGISASWMRVFYAVKSIQLVENLRKVPLVILKPYSIELNPLYAATLGIVKVLEKPIRPNRIVSETIEILGEQASPPAADELIQGSHIGDVPGEGISEEGHIDAGKEEVRAAPDEPEYTEPVQDKAHELPEIPEQAASIDLPSREPEDKDATGKETVLQEKVTESSLSETDYEFRQRKKSFIRKYLIIYGFFIILAATGIGIVLLKDRSEKQIDSFFRGPAEPEQAYQETGGPYEPPRVESKEDSGTTEPIRNEPLLYPPLEEPEEQVPVIESPALPADKQKAAPVRRVPAAKSTFQKTGSTQAGAAAPAKEPVSGISSGPEGNLQPQTEPPAKITFSVQVGAFSKEENAGALMDSLKSKGYNAFILSGDRSGRVTLHRVLVGAFENRADALKHSRVIQQREGLKTVIYGY